MIAVWYPPRVIISGSTSWLLANPRVTECADELWIVIFFRKFTVWRNHYVLRIAILVLLSLLGPQFFLSSSTQTCVVPSKWRFPNRGGKARAAWSRCIRQAPASALPRLESAAGPRKNEEIGTHLFIFLVVLCDVEMEINWKMKNGNLFFFLDYNI